jgi:hypothetical protein
MELGSEGRSCPEKSEHSQKRLVFMLQRLAISELAKVVYFCERQRRNHPSLLQDTDYGSVALTLAFPICYTINSNTTYVNLSLHSLHEAPHGEKTKCNL